MPDSVCVLLLFFLFFNYLFLYAKRIFCIFSVLIYNNDGICVLTAVLLRFLLSCVSLCIFEKLPIILFDISINIAFAFSIRLISIHAVLSIAHPIINIDI